MICTQCGREIPDRSLSCNYCGKIFVNKRAPSEGGADNVQGTNKQTVTPQKSAASMKQALASAAQGDAALNRAVSQRHAQRYIFYIIFAVMFVVCLAIILKLYSDNTEALNSLNAANTKYKQKEKDAEVLQSKVSESTATVLKNAKSIEEMKGLLVQANNDLEEAKKKYQEVETNLEAKNQEMQKMADNLLKSQAVARNIVLESGVRVSASELAKIPPAELKDLTGTDTDKDLLPDDIETIIGTNPMKADSDGDGFDDYAEVSKGFNPIGKGAWPSDPKIIEKYRGRILLGKTNGVTNAWYLGQNGKRYFLGTTADDFTVMRDNVFWNKVEAK